jgi:hypothetical protein
VQLILVENVANVHADVGNGGLKQLRQLALRQPDCHVLQPHFNARPVVLRLIENDFRMRKMDGWSWNPNIEPRTLNFEP